MEKFCYEIMSTALYFSICCLLVECVSIPELKFNDRLIKSSRFVDKSELFLELFRLRCSEPALVTFPPKFGKTTNLHMLKKLLQIELDHNFRPRPLIRTSAYHLLQNLKLAKHEEVCSAHVAQHPVILLDLKYDVEGNVTHEKLVAGLADKIRQIFAEHEWLIDRLPESVSKHGDFFRKALRAELSEKELLDSLHVMSEILYEYFNRSKVVFLVDDFDYVSKYDFINPLITDRLYFMIHSIILNVTKSPYCTTRSLILSVSDRKVGSPLYGNLRQFPFLEEDFYSPFFGILPAELDQLFDRHQCLEEERANVKKWYAGYETNLVYRPVYNTYTIVEYFRHRDQHDALRPYWAAVQDTSFIRQFLRVPLFRTKYNELLRYGSICYRFRKRRLLGEKNFLPAMSNDNKDVIVSQDMIKELIGFLFEQGYLGHRNYMKEVSFKIPNLEIETLLLSEAMLFYLKHDISAANVSVDLHNILTEQDDSTDFLLAANFQASMQSMLGPMRRAAFRTSTELEFFNVVLLALRYLKLNTPETEVIMKWSTLTGRDEMVLVSRAKAMLINIDPDLNRIMPDDRYMCGCIRNRNMTHVRLLALSVYGSYQAKCFVRTVRCDST